MDKVTEPSPLLRGKSPRQAAKNINFLLAFGGTEYKLSEDLLIPIDEAKSMIVEYLAKAPKLKQYFDNCSNYAKKHRYIRSFKPFSFIRWLLPNQFRPDAIHRRALNTPIQGTGAIMTKLALIYIRRYIKDNNLQDKIKLVHVVHDAPLTECHESIVEEWALIKKELINKAGKVFITDIPVLSDTKINTYWEK
jgi:DNA polymerase-1